MSLLIASRTAQSPLVADFTFNFNDTMADTSGNVADFGETNLAATTVMIIPLPPGATVTGGAVSTTEIFDSATVAVTLGDSGDAARYLTSASIAAVGSIALVPTGYAGIGENVEMTFTVADVCTTGSATVSVEYTVADRSCEVQIA
jgi:hypothetical protein